MYWLKRMATGGSMNSLRLFSARMAGLFILLGLTLSAVQAQAASTALKWGTIVGTTTFGDVVGVGTGAVDAAAPWYTVKGSASVNLTTKKVSFSVTGLTLAVGSAPSVPLSGLVIGTPAGVTQITGTLVCNVDGTVASSTGNSVKMNTEAVGLDSKGNASLKSSFSSIDPSCISNPGDTAFLITIAEPVPDAGLYIAFGAVLTF